MGREGSELKLGVKFKKGAMINGTRINWAKPERFFIENLPK